MRSTLREITNDGSFHGLSVVISRSSRKSKEKKSGITERVERDRSDPFCRVPSRFPEGISRGKGMKEKETRP